MAISDFFIIIIIIFYWADEIIHLDRRDLLRHRGIWMMSHHYIHFRISRNIKLPQNIYGMRPTWMK